MTIDPHDAIDILVQCDGNINLAIERSKVSKADFLSAVAETSTIQILLERMRALALLRLFDMFNKAYFAAEVALSDIDPKDAVKNFSSLAAQLAVMTSNKDQSIVNNTLNVADVTLKMLPPEIREAVLNLTEKEIKTLAPGA